LKNIRKQNELSRIDKIQKKMYKQATQLSFHEQMKGSVRYLPESTWQFFQKWFENIMVVSWKGFSDNIT